MKILKELSTVYTMKGLGETLDVYMDKLTITPKGLTGFMYKPFKGSKTIMFYSLSAIQFKKAGWFANGYLQFTVPGGLESRKGVRDAKTDENTFMFSIFSGVANELATEIKDYIEKRIGELKKPQTASTSPSIADELQKLADLKAKGLLSEYEKIKCPLCDSDLSINAIACPKCGQPITDTVRLDEVTRINRKQFIIAVAIIGFILLAWFIHSLPEPKPESEQERESRIEREVKREMELNEEKRKEIQRKEIERQREAMKPVLEKACAEGNDSACSMLRKY